MSRRPPAKPGRAQTPSLQPPDGRDDSKHASDDLPPCADRYQTSSQCLGLLNDPAPDGEQAQSADDTPVAASAGPQNETERLLTPSLPRDASALVRLKALLKIFQTDDRVLIIISADPDAIASAVAFKRLMWRRAAQVVVATINQVKRPDNLHLLKVLKLKMEPLGAINPAAFSKLVMVDSQPHHSPLTRQLPFDVVIDHHPYSPLSPGLPTPAFVDIRPELGATATMLTGYLKASAIKPNQRLATALFYAIKTDTQNFVRQGQIDDMNAFRWLYPGVHATMLSDIERAPIAKSSYRKIVTGLNNAVFSKNTVYTFIGKADHADTLVIVADFLMQVKGVNLSMASGVCGHKLVVILRSSGGPRQNVGKLAKQAFEGLGSAGGHKNMARAEILLENLDHKIRDNNTALTRFILRCLSDHNSCDEH